MRKAKASSLFSVTIQFATSGPSIKEKIQSETLEGLTSAYRDKRNELQHFCNEIGMRSMRGKWTVKKDGETVGTLNFNGTIAEAK
jgi:hypothetical protein